MSALRLYRLPSSSERNTAAGIFASAGPAWRRGEAHRVALKAMADAIEPAGKTKGPA